MRVVVELVGDHTHELEEVGEDDGADAVDHDVYQKTRDEQDNDDAGEHARAMNPTAAVEHEEVDERGGRDDEEPVVADGEGVQGAEGAV